MAVAVSVTVVVPAPQSQVLVLQRDLGLDPRRDTQSIT